MNNAHNIQLVRERQSVKGKRLAVKGVKLALPRKTYSLPPVKVTFGDIAARQGLEVLSPDMSLNQE